MFPLDWWFPRFHRSLCFGDMGAIAAILNEPACEPGDIQRMLEAAPHRGSASQVIAYGYCVLGASSAGGRPESSLARSDLLAVSCTGVLDNARELTREFEVRTTDEAPVSVADIVLAVFTRLGGELAPDRLRGAFAAVVSDGRQLWCFRDHVGFATLFYARRAGRICVATEPKQVLAGMSARREPDLETVERIFFADLRPDSPSALKDVERVPNATIVWSDGSSLRRSRYWYPERQFESARLSPDDLQDCFDELMFQAARRTVTGSGDVVSLSGGVDSPAVAAYAAPVHYDSVGSGLAALSAVYPTLPAVDERRYVELVAERLGLRLHVYQQRADPLKDLERWARLVDAPVDSIAMPEIEEHYLTASRLGYRTLLDGQIAENVFEMNGYLLGHLLRTRRLSALSLHLKAQRARGAPVRGLLAQLGYAYAPRSVVAAYKHRRGRPRGRNLPGWIDASRMRAGSADAAVPASRRWLEEQLNFIGPPSPSMEADDVGQAVCGVSVRHPWADVELWEFFLSLPADVKFPAPGRKVLVRQLLRGRVPDEILDRRDKTVFDDFFMSRIDYAVLRHWLSAPTYRLSGISYDMLNSALEAQKMTVHELLWAKELAGVHAFLATF